MLSVLLNGFPTDRFFSDFLEQKPLLVRRSGEVWDGESSSSSSSLSFSAAATSATSNRSLSSGKKRKRSEKTGGGGLFTLNELKAIVARGGVFFRIHLNAFRYLGGETKEDCTPRGVEEEGPPLEVTPEVVDFLFGAEQGEEEAQPKRKKKKKKEKEKEGKGRKIKALAGTPRASLQFHQPQQHSDRLWAIMHALESETQTLWGANVYMTPVCLLVCSLSLSLSLSLDNASNSFFSCTRFQPAAQGLAPHHDDIDAFVVQCEGRKRWRVYEPTAEQFLASHCSGDLPQPT